MIGRPDATTLRGPAGQLEAVLEDPPGAPRGLAVIAHPHPQMGGTLDNKVVHTLSKAFLMAGWRAVRFNFRGVGQSEGAWDEGVGEVDDFLAVLAHHRADPAVSAGPLALAGFSFGGFVAARATARLAEPPTEVVLVSPAIRYGVPAVPAHTLVVQGEEDDVVPMADVIGWARPQGLPVTVVPGVGHFFHGQLGPLRERVLRHLRGAPAA